MAVRRELDPGLKAPSFQTLIAEKDTQCFELETTGFSELAPLLLGDSQAEGARP